MRNNQKIELPVHEVITYNKLDNMVAYISATAFIAMSATLLIILSL